MTTTTPIYDPPLSLEEKVEGGNYTLLLPIALADANSIRHALAIGDGVLPELPKGQLGNSEQCVLARALSNGWKATVNSDETHLLHPFEGKTAADVRKAVEALEQMGFACVSHGSYGEPDADRCGCGDPSCSDNTNGYWIEVPHTWAMSMFITLFDGGHFPDLILTDESS
jgi:hypothetical protein